MFWPPAHHSASCLNPVCVCLSVPPRPACRLCLCLLLMAVQAFLTSQFTERAKRRQQLRAKLRVQRLRQRKAPQPAPSRVPTINTVVSNVSSVPWGGSRAPSDSPQLLELLARMREVCHGPPAQVCIRRCDAPTSNRRCKSTGRSGCASQRSS